MSCDSRRKLKESERDRNVGVGWVLQNIRKRRGAWKDVSNGRRDANDS